MNKENLTKMAKHILTVPEEQFDMEIYRTGNCKSHECNSTGCIIGHCTILDDWENIPFCDENINFVLWSERFTGIDRLDELWDYLFSEYWSKLNDTPQKAHDRIMLVVNGGDWEKEYQEFLTKLDEV